MKNKYSSEDSLSSQPWTDGYRGLTVNVGLRATGAAPHLDGKNVVFGKVISGHDVVKAIEAVGTGSGRTNQRVTITACGEVVSAEKK